MKINRDNYEQYFLDHMEGNLSPEQERELADFLVSNPDLARQLEDYDAISLPHEEIGNDSLKQRLKKSIHVTEHIDQDNVDEWMIRKVEGLLTALEDAELAEFLRQNPAYSYDLEKFYQARLQPDMSVTFNRKEQLKKRAAVMPLNRLAWIIPAATAAIVLVWVGIKFLSYETKPPLIETTSQIVSPVQPEEQTSQKEDQKVQTTATIPVKKNQGMESQGMESQGMESPGTTPRVEPFRLQTALFVNELPMTPAGTEALPLLAFSTEPIIVPEEKEKSIVGKVFSNLVSRAKDGLSRQATIEGVDKKDFSIWSIAKAGIEGYNSIADRDIELSVHRNSEGDVTSYALIEDDRLVWEKSRNNN